MKLSGSDKLQQLFNLKQNQLGTGRQVASGCTERGGEAGLGLGRTRGCDHAIPHLGPKAAVDLVVKSDAPGRSPPRHSGGRHVRDGLSTCQPEGEKLSRQKVAPKKER